MNDKLLNLLIVFLLILISCGFGLISAGIICAMFGIFTILYNINPLLGFGAAFIILGISIFLMGYAGLDLMLGDSSENA